MNCLNANLIKKISQSVTIDELINLRDRKDKLTSKIYMKKLEELTSEEAVPTTYYETETNNKK